LLCEVLTQLLLVRARGDEVVETLLPEGELGGIGIDGLHPLGEVAERRACRCLFVRGLAFIGVFNDIGMADAVSGTEDDFVVFGELAVHIFNGVGVVYCCHIGSLFVPCLFLIEALYPTVILRLSIGYLTVKAVKKRCKGSALFWIVQIFLKEKSKKSKVESD